MNGGSLFLCHRLPFPPNKGDKIRSYQLLKHLAERGPVHLACFIDDPEDLKHRDEVRRIAGGSCFFGDIGKTTKWLRAAKAVLSGQPITTAYFSSRALARWVRNILATENLENTIIFGSAMAPYLIGDLAHSRGALFDMVDVDSDKWRQYAKASRGLWRSIYTREARTVAALEREAARAFGKTLLISPFEAETFRKLAPESADKIAELNNGVDLDRFSPSDFVNPFPPGELAIVMTGRMDYRPNYDGAIWFAQHVAPRILARLPQAHVYFVGSSPPAALRKVGGPKITVTDAVDDVRPYIQFAEAVVAPLLIARGVQNKVLEAMAMKKPVVATHEATRALNVTSGEHLWIENEPQRFSDAVIVAVQSPVRNRVMENARRYVEEHHNWQKIFCDLDQILEKLARDVATNSQTALRAPVTTVHSYKPNITGAKA